MNFHQGEILAFDKPYQLTSFGLVARVRWLLTQKLGTRIKVGHAGTLDPLATGVLILCTGKATKRIEEMQSHVKEYVATLKLGATTASFDKEYPEDATYPTDHITRQLVDETIQNFIGTIQQIPPAFSACKINGTHAYHIARRGKEVELKPKTLTIDEIEVLAFGLQELTIRVVCSKGTYIRALARDIGVALNSGAYLTSLTRTRVGKIKIEDCIKLDDFPAWLDKQEIEDIQENETPKSKTENPK